MVLILAVVLVVVLAVVLVVVLAVVLVLELRKVEEEAGNVRGAELEMWEHVRWEIQEGGKKEEQTGRESGFGRREEGDGRDRRELMRVNEEGEGEGEGKREKRNQDQGC